MKKLVIAVDGPAASGKGTIARRIAESLHLAYLDTGSVYRAVALRMLEQNKAPNDLSAAQDAASYVAITQGRICSVLRLCGLTMLRR
jgi:cytidylate kinase